MSDGSDVRSETRSRRGCGWNNYAGHQTYRMGCPHCAAVAGVEAEVKRLRDENANLRLALRIENDRAEGWKREAEAHRAVRDR